MSRLARSRPHLESWHMVWNPSKIHVPVHTLSYRVCTGTCQYENLVLTCTSTWFLYWYVHGMYFTVFCNASMYRYVLAKDRAVFSGYDVVTQSWNVTGYLAWHITAFLSVPFQKIQCSLVAQYTWSVLGMYQVHTRDLLVLTVTKMLWYVQCMYHVFAMYVKYEQCMYIVCTMYGNKCYCMYTVCTMYIHITSTCIAMHVCTRVLVLITAGSTKACNLYAQSKYIHSMYNVCTLFIHMTYTVCVSTSPITFKWSVAMTCKSLV